MLGRTGRRASRHATIRATLPKAMFNNGGSVRVRPAGAWASAWPPTILYVRSLIPGDRRALARDFMPAPTQALRRRANPRRSQVPPSPARWRLHGPRRARISRPRARCECRTRLSAGGLDSKYHIILAFQVERPRVAAARLPAPPLNTWAPGFQPSRAHHGRSGTGSVSISPTPAEKGQRGKPHAGGGGRVGA